jgi:hypothetical protein
MPAPPAWQGLTHAGGDPVGQVGLETGQHARAKQADDGAAQLEQAHLGALCRVMASSPV